MYQDNTHMSSQYDLGPDISEALFDNVLRGDVFNAWKLKASFPQLRVVGGPGSGKSALASIVARRLRESYSHNDHAIATVFMHPQMQWDQRHREAVLFEILRQLHENSNSCEGPNAPGLEPVTATLRAVQDQGLESDTILILQQALKERLTELEQAFLILDGTNRCDWLSTRLLENDLLELESSGLKVLITSRTLAFDEEEWSETSCDVCLKEALQIYWRCDSGKHEEVYISCEQCHQSNEICPNSECLARDSYIQPYTRRRIDMYEAVSGTLSSFVAQDLETEHGDMGLNSTALDKPPLSRLGYALLNSRRHHAAQWLRDHITNLADCNIALARLRIDIAHENMSAIEEAEALPGGLPYAVTAFFDAVINGIQVQEEFDSGLGLKTLALWADGAESEDELVEQLVSLGGVAESECTIDRILYATRGCLMVGKLEDKPILPYSYTFRTYVTGGYCGVVDKVRVELGRSRDALD
ncbi:putative AAA+ ATPase domain-containing protein [Seiridium cardinale]|uniref:AAA+ ATPase domain-containing protein n=1 Tax=Seiridium cardinale TaxID=138064 RepID=A0ABR2XEV8_9PEZI